MKELLINLPTFIALLFWLFCVAVFSVSMWNRKSDLWKMVIGSDNQMQKTEAVLFYWLFLFPIAIFTILLMAILDIKMEEYHVDLFKWVLGILEAVLASILGHDLFKANRKNTDKSK